MVATKSRKGFYEILGTFFLIVILVAVAIGYLAFQNGFLILRQGVNKELNDYTLAVVIRENLFSCYGSSMRPDLMHFKNCSDGTPIDLEALEKMIQGYDIEQLNLFNCSTENWGWNNTENKPGIPSEFVYFVPIVDNRTNYNCLGKMTIVI